MCKRAEHAERQGHTARAPVKPSCCGQSPSSGQAVVSCQCGCRLPRPGVRPAGAHHPGSSASRAPGLQHRTRPPIRSQPLGRQPPPPPAHAARGEQRRTADCQRCWRRCRQLRRASRAHAAPAPAGWAAAQQHRVAGCPEPHGVCAERRQPGSCCQLGRRFHSGRDMDNGSSDPASPVPLCRKLERPFCQLRCRPHNLPAGAAQVQRAPAGARWAAQHGRHHCAAAHAGRSTAEHLGQTLRAAAAQSGAAQPDPAAGLAISWHHSRRCWVRGWPPSWRGDLRCQRRC